MRHQSHADLAEDGYFTDDELAPLDMAAWRRLDGPERTAIIRALFRSCAPSAPVQAIPVLGTDSRGAASFCTFSGSSPPTGSRNTLHPLARLAERTTGDTTNPAAEVQPFARSADFEPLAAEHGPERAPLPVSTIGGRS